MEFWKITIVLTILIAAILSQNIFWRRQPPAQTASSRVFRYVGLFAASFLFSTTLTLWYYSARCWSSARAESEAAASSERAKRDAAEAEREWTESRSSRPSTYPSDATPTSPSETARYQNRVFGTREAPRQRIDEEYEQTLQPGYAPKF